MTSCRICLALKPRKNITDLTDPKNSNSEGYKKIISFCLGIKMEQDLKLCSKLCTKCYKKLLEFYQFKALALKNDCHWKSLTDSSSLDELKEEPPNDAIKAEIESVNGEDQVIDSGFVFDTLDNEEIKVEVMPEEESDTELLSDVKNIKYELLDYMEEEKVESQNNIKSIAVKRRRGRPKITKSPRNKQEMKVGPLKVCEECGKVVRNLKEHIQVHLPPEQRKHIKCDLCDKIFTTYQAHYRHRMRKHFAKREECDICHKSVFNVKLHKRMHFPEMKKYVCSACGRGFTTKTKLALHVTVHTKERPHECDLCPAKFRLKLSFQNHKRSVHNKEKSHLCQYCSKRFFKKVHLQTHLRSHTKEKPYSCPTCGKCFAANATLKNHQTIHSKEKKHSCKLCDMTFARSGYLITHMKSHLKVKKFHCQFCSMSFHRSDHRKRHEYTAHLKNAALTPT